MKINFYKTHKIHEGYIALLSVIVLGVVGASIMLSVVLSGIGALKTDLALQQGSQARTVASSCGEEALQKILETGTTTSSGNLAIASGTCLYTITSQSGSNITINATGLVGTITSKVKIVIATTSPSIVLSSWQEVGDF
jgi:hypothetical protein